MAKQKENDDRIKQMLKKVEELEKDVAKQPRRTLVTNGVFPHENGDMMFNLNTVNDLAVLVGAVAFLKSKKNFAEEAAKELGLDDVVKFSWGGYSYEDWLTDIKDRVHAITYQEKKKMLAKMKGKLNKLISSDARTEMELDEIAAMLK